jgi:hypothetical protein
MNGIGPLIETFHFLPDDPRFDMVKVKGQFRAEIHRKDGTVEDLGFLNGVCNLGFNYMLDAPFRNYSGGATLYPYWFIGLISNSSFSALAAADTAASHSGWTEDSTHYTPATYTGAVNNGGGYAGGTGTMTIDLTSQAITNGTPFTVAGDSTTHTVLSSVGGATPTSITFTPTLGSSVSDDAVITFNNGRGLWIPGAAASKSITNSSSVNFAMNTDSTVIKGIFVISDPTLGGTAGLLWSSGLFSSDQTLFNGDTLKITYTVSLS